jgi:hypothetical protein
MRNVLTSVLILFLAALCLSASPDKSYLHTVQLPGHSGHVCGRAVDLGSGLVLVPEHVVRDAGGRLIRTITVDGIPAQHVESGLDCEVVTLPDDIPERYDWAIYRLDRPLLTGRDTEIGLAGAGAIVYYFRDGIARPVTTADVTEYEVGFTGVAPMDGDSGSPVLDCSGDKPVAVGWIIGTHDPECSSGVCLPSPYSGNFGTFHAEVKAAIARARAAE